MGFRELVATLSRARARARVGAARDYREVEYSLSARQKAMDTVWLAGVMEAVAMEVCAPANVANFMFYKATAGGVDSGDPEFVSPPEQAAWTNCWAKLTDMYNKMVRLQFASMLRTGCTASMTTPVLKDPTLKGKPASLSLAATRRLGGRAQVLQGFHRSADRLLRGNDFMNNEDRVALDRALDDIDVTVGIVGPLRCPRLVMCDCLTTASALDGCPVRSFNDVDDDAKRQAERVRMFELAKVRYDVDPGATTGDRKFVVELPDSFYVDGSSKPTDSSCQPVSRTQMCPRCKGAPKLLPHVLRRQLIWNYEHKDELDAARYTGRANAVVTQMGAVVEEFKKAQASCEEARAAYDELAGSVPASASGARATIRGANFKPMEGYDENAMFTSEVPLRCFVDKEQAVTQLAPANDDAASVVPDDASVGELLSASAENRVKMKVQTSYKLNVRCQYDAIRPLVVEPKDLQRPDCPDCTCPRLEDVIAVDPRPELVIPDQVLTGQVGPMGCKDPLLKEPARDPSTARQPYIVDSIIDGRVWVTKMKDHVALLKKNADALRASTKALQLYKRYIAPARRGAQPPSSDLWVRETSFQSLEKCVNGVRKDFNEWRQKQLERAQDDFSPLLGPFFKYLLTETSYTSTTRSLFKPPQCFLH